MRSFLSAPSAAWKRKLVPAEGFELQKIEIGGLNRVGLRQTFATLGRLPVATVSMRPLRPRRVRRLQHGRLCRRAAGDGGASAAHSGGGDGAERGPGIHQSVDRALRLARAGLLPGDRALLSRSGRTEVTGLPVREEFFRIPPKPRGDVLHIC